MMVIVVLSIHAKILSAVFILLWIAKMVIFVLLIGAMQKLELVILFLDFMGGLIIVLLVGVNLPLEKLL
jgi:hypothetical protein